MLETVRQWVGRERAVRPRLWAGASAAALVLGVCAADAQSSVTSSGAADGAAAAALPAPAPGLSESAKLRSALSAAESGNIAAARVGQATLADPVARKLVLWAMIDAAGSSVDFFTLDSAQKELAGWPRAARRQAAAEKAMAVANISPTATIAWFAAREPTTAEGAMALASAYQQSARTADAQALIKGFWRGKSFAPEQQTAMLTRFGSYLAAEDHAARLSNLLYQGATPSTRAMMDLVAPDQKAVAEARLALHAERSDATKRVEALTAAQQADAGLAYDRARYLRKHNLDTLAVGFARNFAKSFESQDAASEVWKERRALMMAAIRSGNAQGAYQAVADNGLTGGPDFTEAEFFAGWVALTKLKNPTLADEHFAKVQTGSQTPITQSRAFYWRGRAAQARGDTAAAQDYWTQGAKYLTAFYGQLSAEKAGITKIALTAEPTPTAADRTSFEAREIVKAARMLGDLHERELFRAFVLSAGDTLPSTQELALLTDMAKMYGDQDLSMRVVRGGAMRNIILPERGYPTLPMPQGSSFAEPAFALAISRQESNFDPHARSAFAVGIMQLRPSTAASVARKIGLDYGPGRLEQAEYNVKVGSSYLGGLVSDFGGSYVLAAAAYNAGPGRPPQWIAACGDPRQGSIDPSDFIECIPFSETRNYVMRILETTQVYRARLNGGSAPLTPTADLHRGGWQPLSAAQPLVAKAAASTPTPLASAVLAPSVQTP